MKRLLALVPALVLALALLPAPRASGSGVELAPVAAPLAAPLGTEFTYQGLLKQSGAPANGTFSLEFRLFDAATGGTQLGSQTLRSVPVSNGLFTVLLDFRVNAFTGDARWLEIVVSGTPLTPRQALTPTPYALFAQRVADVLTGITNTAVGQNALAGNTTGSENTAVGKDALSANTTGFRNTAVGQDALRANTTAFRNTAVGQNALAVNTTGGANTAVGQDALQANSTGASNTAVGEDALRVNTTGFRNTAVGQNALQANATGENNTALGMSTLAVNTTGINNTAVGAEALFLNSTGASNTAVGKDALFKNTTGINNTALGNLALDRLGSGNNNVAVGTAAGTDYAGAESDNIVVGHAGVAGESSTIRIGTPGTQTRAFVAGIHGATVAGGAAVLVNSQGQLGTTTSSARFKEQIEDLGPTSALVQQLRPVSFFYRPEYGGGPEQPQVGLIAEEVAEAAPWLVAYDADEAPYTVRYELLAPLLLNELQAQQQTIQRQASEHAALRAANAALEARLAAIERAFSGAGTAE